MRYGHFDNEKREYVIDRVDIPTSWTNYLGVEDTCAVVNHTAGGYFIRRRNITEFPASTETVSRWTGLGTMCTSGMTRAGIIGAFPGSR